MDIRKKVVGILNDVNPAKRLEDVTDIIGGGYIDSFELMLLVSKLNESFEIEITIDDLTPENFMSADSIASMIENMKK